MYTVCIHVLALTNWVGRVSDDDVKLVLVLCHELCPVLIVYLYSVV